MTDVRKAFGKGKAFIPFITVGDPDLETSERILYALAEGGASLIELGIPFSDPTAEGPVIQAANKRGLLSGTTTDKVFSLIRKMRSDGFTLPLAIMTYANVVMAYGTERFLERMAEADISALILPDVPFEEKKEFSEPCRAHGISLISLIAPTSNERIKRIAEDADGFIYCVSSLGVTGMRDSITTDIGAMIRLVREADRDIPVAVGFGISSPEQAGKMALLSDGVIIGSAIVDIIAKSGERAPEEVQRFAESIRKAIS